MMKGSYTWTLKAPLLKKILFVLEDAGVVFIGYVKRSQEWGNEPGARVLAIDTKTGKELWSREDWPKEYRWLSRQGLWCYNWILVKDALVGVYNNSDRLLRIERKSGQPLGIVPLLSSALWLAQTPSGVSLIECSTKRFDGSYSKKKYGILHADGALKEWSERPRSEDGTFGVGPLWEQGASAVRLTLDPIRPSSVGVVSSESGVVQRTKLFRDQTEGRRIDWLVYNQEHDIYMLFTQSGSNSMGSAHSRKTYVFDRAPLIRYLMTEGKRKKRPH
ncbi:MAG: hypothetical protein ACYTGH_15235 [Planctomycetota bacterium]